jgi:hypothetical protein
MGAGRIVLQSPLDELMDGSRSITGGTVAVRQQAQAQGWQVLCETPLSDGRLRVLARGGVADSAGPGVAVNAVTLEDLFLGLTQ